MLLFESNVPFYSKMLKLFILYLFFYSKVLSSLNTTDVEDRLWNLFYADCQRRLDHLCFGYFLARDSSYYFFDNSFRPIIDTKNLGLI